MIAGRALPDGRKPRVHFSGIGGTGMVAVARLAIEAGWEVRGSDNPLYPPTSGMVAALGVPVAQSYAAENLDWAPDVVVVGNALGRGNAEVEAMLDRGLPYMSFPEWLRHAVLQDRRPTVIAGTHGKTTTTAITAFLLDAAGLHPGYMIGGQPLDFTHSSAIGVSAGPFVIEGDEYDTAFFDKRAKFFHYLPRTLVVTSLEFDHADIYSSVDEIERAFRLLLRQVPEQGHVLLCADHPGALALRDAAFSNVITYGRAPDADWRVEPAGYSDAGQQFRLFRHGELLGEFATALLGRYNLQNVAAAIAAATLEGVPLDVIQRALPTFRGIRRRIEIFARSNGLTFIEDFAHHPTAIREAIAAVKERWPQQQLTVLFEPRSNTTATNRFQHELGAAFAGANEVWIGPIYRGDKYAPEVRLDRDRLVADIRAENARAQYADDVREIVRHIRAEPASHQIVLILSNGAFGGIYDMIRSQFAHVESF